MTGLRRIGPDELRELGRAWHMELDPAEAEQLGLIADDVLAVLDPLAAPAGPAAEPVPAVREAGARPAFDEDPLNAVVRWCRVKAHEPGDALAGLRVAIKDSMAIAGVPMTLGSTVLEDFVPDVDAVVVERLLVAGAELVAITNMDHFAFSGGGDSSSYGPTLNPFDHDRTAGGSSSGSAAALWYDGIDAALGTDQGGSIRVPAAWCGIVGLKPTHSLVPYTGIAGIDATFDHAGPMTRTVADAARVLGVIAGAHPSDPRQAGGVPVEDYVRAVAEAPEELGGLRVGLVAEGFAPEIGTDPAVAAAVRGAAGRLAELGADVQRALAARAPDRGRARVRGLRRGHDRADDGRRQRLRVGRALLARARRGARRGAARARRPALAAGQGRADRGRAPAPRAQRGDLRARAEPAAGARRGLRPRARAGRRPAHADDSRAAARARPGRARRTSGSCAAGRCWRTRRRPT